MQADREPSAVSGLEGSPEPNSLGNAVTSAAALSFVCVPVTAVPGITAGSEESST